MAAQIPGAKLVVMPNSLVDQWTKELQTWGFFDLVFLNEAAKSEKDRSIFFIRLLTRLIFCWFLQEKGLIPRYTKLPWIPNDDQWQAILRVTGLESIRNRMMLALAYDAGLRREELCALRTDDLDPQAV